MSLFPCNWKSSLAAIFFDWKSKWDPLQKIISNLSFPKEILPWNHPFDCRSLDSFGILFRRRNHIKNRIECERNFFGFVTTNNVLIKRGSILESVKMSCARLMAIAAVFSICLQIRLRITHYLLFLEKWAKLKKNTHTHIFIQHTTKSIKRIQFRQVFYDGSSRNFWSAYILRPFSTRADHLYKA